MLRKLHVNNSFNDGEQLSFMHCCLWNWCCDKLLRYIVLIL